MPLLPLEPFLYPDDLLRLPPAGGDDGRWWVLHTRPRAEKSLARRLLAGRVPFFLPLHSRQWRNNGRSFSSHMPLFPGYVFLRGNDDARVAALTTNLIVNVLPVPDQARLTADLLRVHRLMGADVALTAEESLQPGTPVRVAHGPLAGVEGKVIRRGNGWKFFIEVQFLQRGVSVEIEHWMIEPLEGRTAETAPAAKFAR
jgi:transcriptional antiterminator RfaH